jgi:Type II secretion system (T2SS), protein G
MRLQAAAYLTVLVFLGSCTRPASRSCASSQKDIQTQRSLVGSALVNGHEADLDRKGLTALRELGLVAGPVEDPWGNEYQYRRAAGSRGFVVFSYGPDGVPSGDDIDETTKCFERK